ncbi:MAG TPA: hypothetical protein VGE38_08980 [Nocardioides sp.]|uniref:hypothetical protein n=1 Tax=Nocardioides sp. TaxID=35761 RepID=UPI002ED7ED1B
MELTVEESLATRLEMDEEALAPFTTALDSAQLRALDSIVEAALVAEDEAVRRAVEEAIEAVPWPVRSAARAILMGDS